MSSPANLGGDLYATATCQGVEPAHALKPAADANGYAAAIYLYAADLVLEQQAGPTVSGGVAGELASASTVGGLVSAHLRRERPTAQASTRSCSRSTARSCRRTVPNENGGRCRNVGRDQRRAAGVPVRQALPPVAQRPGRPRHDEDPQRHPPAGGQRARRGGQLGSRARTPDHRPQRGDRPAERDQRHRPGGAVGAVEQAPPRAGWWFRFGRSATVEGRLTAVGGVPIAGASIDVSAEPTATGAGRRRCQRRKRTPPAASRSSSPEESPRGRCGSATGPTSPKKAPPPRRPSPWRCKAGIVLHISPDVTSVGRAIHFSGRLRGGPVPSEGKQLVLEARSPGGPWIEFRGRPQRSPGAVPRGLPLQVPGAGPLPVPGDLRTGVRLPLRPGLLEPGGGVRALRVAARRCAPGAGASR